MRKIIKLDPHFLGALLAAEAACSVLEVLPATDLIEDLRNLVYIQRELLNHMVEGKHFGTNNITNFVQYTQIVKDDMFQLTNCTEEDEEYN